MTGSGEAAGRGTLVLIVGPSGVGKDSLIAWCRARTGDSVAFPRRVVTRAAAGGSEDHDTISEEGFAAAIASGDFALHWRAHGLGYGIPGSVVDDLSASRHVVINVSRAVLDEARRRFVPVLIVSVTAPAHVLAERLSRRAREPEPVIGARLARAGSYAIAGTDVVTVDNSGPIEEAGRYLLALLSALDAPRVG